MQQLWRPYKNKKGLSIHKRTCLKTLEKVCNQGGFRHVRGGLFSGLQRRAKSATKAFNAAKDLLQTGKRVYNVGKKAVKNRSLSDAKEAFQELGNLAPTLRRIGNAVKETVGNGINPFPNTREVPIAETTNQLLRICRCHIIQLPTAVANATIHQAKGGFLGSLAKQLLPTLIPIVANSLFSTGSGIPELDRYNRGYANI